MKNAITIEKMENEIKVLNDKMGEMRSRAKEKGRELTDEEMGELKKVIVRMKELRGKIELEYDLNATSNAVAAPTTEPVRPNPEERSGVELGTDRASLDKFGTFGDQLQAVIRSRTDNYSDPRLTTRSIDGMSEGTGADGGFLVQTDHSTKILGPVWDSNEVLKRINRLPLSGPSNAISIPAVDETSRADGSRSGGLKFYDLGEGSEKTASQPKLRTIELKLNKMAAVVYLTDELMLDVTALEAWVTKKVTEELDFKLQNDVINGGGGSQALGIVNSGAIVTQTQITGQGENSIVYDNIIDMWARLKADSRKNAIWLINQDVEPQLFKMSLPVGTGGTAVYLPMGGASSSPYRTLMGREVVPVEQCSTVGDVGDILLCDWSKYIGIEKGGLRKDSSIHVKFLEDQTALRFTYRFDGQPELASPITPYSDGDTLSHFVQLETRT